MFFFASQFDMHQDHYFMQLAFDLAWQGRDAGEVPVGAVLVRQAQVIGQGFNQPIARHDASAHAEIIAIRDAGQRIGNYRLLNTVLYTTLEPCPMCAAAIIHARIQKVVFAAYDPRSGACGSVFDLLPSDHRFNHRTEVKGGLYGQNSANLLRQFFRTKRK